MQFINNNIKFRYVEEYDAEFIIKLRTHTSKSKYISYTDQDIEKQVNWIREYKKREKNKLEYYFIAIDENNIQFATYRLYNLNETTLEIGSFVSLPYYNNPINIIKVDIILKSYAFENLKYNKINFEVRKENKNVINYHNKYKPNLVWEDDLNFYYVLSKESFNSNKKIFEKIIKL